MAEKLDPRKPAAGWYPHPSMTNTQRYWDGEHWTDHTAPAATMPPKSTGVLTIARGVALGIAMLIGIAWALSAMFSSNDDMECAIRNAERASGERAGPMEVCPD